MPVVVDDNGVVYNTRMVAGSVGIHVSSSGELLDISTMHKYYNRTTIRPELGESAGPDTVQPVTGWWMYEVLEGSEEAAREPDSPFPRRISKPIQNAPIPAGTHPLVSPERRLRVQAAAVAATA